MRQKRFKVGDLVFINFSLPVNKGILNLFDLDKYRDDIGIVTSYSEDISDQAVIFMQKTSSYITFPDQRLSLVDQDVPKL